MYKGFTWSKTLADVTTIINFQSNETGIGVAHLWDFGDGTTSTDLNPNKTYSQAGIYDVVYKATLNSVTHEYKEKRAVRVYPDRSAAPYATWDLAAMQAAGQMSGVHQNYSAIPAGSKIDVTGTVTGVDLWVLDSLQGTAENPIHLCFKNASITADGLRDSCIIWKSCQHVIIDAEGLAVYNAGMDTWQLCTDLEIGGVTMEDGGSAAVKEKFDSVYWPSVYFQNMMLHNAKIKGFGTEGCYLGNSFYMLRGLEAEYKHSMPNAKIFRNHISQCGWDGLQLGMGDDNSEIHDNILEGNATAMKPAHGYGMQVNSGFRGQIYNNVILEGPHGWGGATQFAIGFHSKYYNNLNYAPSGDYALFLKTESNENQTRTITDPEVVVEIFSNTLIAINKAIYIVHSAAMGTPTKIKKLVLKNNAYKGSVLYPVYAPDHQHMPVEVVELENIQASNMDFIDFPLADCNIHINSQLKDTGVNTTTESTPNVRVATVAAYMGAYDGNGVLRTAAYDVGAYAYAPRFEGGATLPPPQEPEPEPQQQKVTRKKKMKLVYI